MTSTLDSINNNINIKLDRLDNIMQIYAEYEIDNEDEKVMAKHILELTELRETYFTVTINIIKEFYQTKDDTVRRSLHNKFVQTFHSCNITGKLKKIYQFCCRLKKKYELEDASVSDLFKDYECVTIDESFEDKGSEMCPKCSAPYDIEEKKCEFICKPCGRIEKMYGVVFEDEQFFYQEGQRTKHGKYYSIKHAKLWTDRIQAKENTKIPKRVINAVKRRIRRDNIWIEIIDCEIIRNYLKQLKLTTYNNHIPLIKKIITKKDPPQFTDHELRLLYMHFSTVIQIFNKIKDADKSNCPYHPYFIYKIVEQLLNKPADQERKKEILSCIHLQSRETLIENDKMWFQICEYIPKFTKVATGTDNKK